MFFLWLTFFILFNIFFSIDFFVFLFFFELIILPLYFIIGLWGSRSRKIFAAYQFFIYTLIGSLFIFFSFLLVFFAVGSSSFDLFYSLYFFEDRIVFIWWSLFLGFSFKLPMVPFHIWLPEAHVEAPTVGSILLAGSILKIAAYAFLRFLIGFSFYFYLDFIFVIYTLSFFSFLYSSMVAIINMI